MATDVVKQIQKATRRQFTAEEKIRVVLEGLRGATPISEICRRHSIINGPKFFWMLVRMDGSEIPNGMPPQMKSVG
jgi:transposase